MNLGKFSLIFDFSFLSSSLTPPGNPVIYWIYLFSLLVTESRVWVLTARKPVKKQEWWKEKFAFFQTTRVVVGEETHVCPKADSAYPQQSGDKSFYRQREGATGRNSTVSPITLKLVIGSLTRVILIILSTINLQLQGQFVSIFLPLILGIVAASIVVTVWSSCT